MHLSVLLFLIISIGYFVCCPGECDVKNTELFVNLKGNSINITIPAGDPEIKSVFLSTKIGDRCSSNYTYVQSVNKSDSFSFELSAKLEFKNDKVRVLSIIETKKHLITKTHDYKFDVNGIATKQIIPEIIGTKPTACNDRKNTRTYDPERKCILAESNPTSTLKNCIGELLFEENFEDNKLTKWTHVEYSPVYTDYAEFVVYMKNETNCYIKENKLHIEATFSKKTFGDSFNLTNCTYKNGMQKKHLCGDYKIRQKTPPPVQSAALHTKKSFDSFMYGRIEIRAKMPIGDWLFPYLLLFPSKSDFESYVIEPHIRIVYVRGNANLSDYAYNDIGGSVLFSSVVMQSDGENHEAMMNTPLKTGTHYGDDFHNFTLIRHSDRIISKVDGVTYGIIDEKRILDSFKDSKFYIVLGLTAGGKLNFRGEYVYRDNNDDFLTSPQALTMMWHKLGKNNFWQQPKLEIEHVHVYATHPDEN